MVRPLELAHKCATKAHRGGQTMNGNIMIIDSDKYSGQYVATKSFQDKTVVCSGSNPVAVSSDAKRKGIEEPVVFYVPEKDMVHIY